ncbi:hypothetical protein LguiB_002777 [Lonicera macranthoides]
MGSMVEEIEQQEEEEYSLLKDLKLEIKGEDGTFSLCFWLYLPININNSTTPFPSTLLQQVHPDIASAFPFLSLHENKKIMLSPLLFLHQEAPTPTNSIPWTEVPCAASKMDFPSMKWVHVGCEVAVDFVRLYIDGEVVGEKPLTSLLDKESHLEGLRKVSLISTDDNDDRIQGYVYSVEVFPLTSSIKDFYVKNPPLQLSVDTPSASEIEVDTDGVWSIVGGKASCRRNFSLDVNLLDAFGQPVNKDMEVVASLLYADNEALVEKPDDAEAPLLTSYDGIEFASWDRPSKLINGRASFKLKISQLSSKCDNKLFRIRFDIPKKGKYPFLEALSHPIRCISRNRNAKTPSFTWRKIPSGLHVLNGSLSEGSTELLHNIVHEAKPSSPLKRVKLGQEKPFVMFKDDNALERANGRCSSPPGTTNEDDTVYGTSLEGRSENHEEPFNSSSDSESSEATDSFLKSNGTPLSDLAVFKYCLSGLTERSLLLKEIAISVSEQELVDFAQQVSLYSGCLHHRHQIIVSKRLIEDGIKIWNMISQDNDHLLWENLVSEIKEHFMKISHCSTRYLVQQDFELLRRIAGCQDIVTRENFEKMWCWLYPVGFTLSQDWINSMWDSVAPKWIEGFITKEEAESSLQGPGGLQDPGTFVLRFPTSRSWPHPDAGNLVVTYVGSNYAIHHRLLSLDFMYSSGTKETGSKPLQDLLLEEPELSRLGRIIRSFEHAR